MRSNSLESNNYHLPASTNKLWFLGRLGLCLSAAGLGGLIAASFVSSLDNPAIRQSTITNAAVLLILLSVPGSLISLAALFREPPRGAACWGVLLGLVGLA